MRRGDRDTLRARRPLIEGHPDQDTQMAGRSCGAKGDAPGARLNTWAQLNPLLLQLQARRRAKAPI